MSDRGVKADLERRDLVRVAEARLEHAALDSTLTRRLPTAFSVRMSQRHMSASPERKMSSGPE